MTDWQRKAASGFVIRGKDGARIAVSWKGALEVHPEDAWEAVKNWLGSRKRASTTTRPARCAATRRSTLR